MRKIFITIFITIFISSCFTFFIFSYFQNQVKKEEINNLKISKEIKNAYIQKLPIYSDYIKKNSEAPLRRYLLADHLRVIQEKGSRAIQNEAEIQTLVKENLLLPLLPDIEDFAFFYNVPKKFRYLKASAKKLIILLGQRFQKNLKTRGTYANVKFAISSALRPVTYQNKLITKNSNASFISSHSYGESFDLFYDEFYVNLPQKEKSVKKKYLYQCPQRVELFNRPSYAKTVSSYTYRKPSRVTERREAICNFRAKATLLSCYSTLTLTFFVGQC